MLPCGIVGCILPVKTVKDLINDDYKQKQINDLRKKIKEQDTKISYLEDSNKELKEYIEKIRDSLLEILAYSEVVIDYAEEDLPENILDQIIEKLKNKNYKYIIYKII